MRTTLNIDDELLARAMEGSGARTKTETVRLALEALVRANAARALADLFGAHPDVKAPPRRGVTL